ncbi:hypothetical protein CHU98_g7596 [Xylaria longipes]|nr:hypothetical protein CHU98_g7596 [Xylaria longipes]
MFPIFEARGVIVAQKLQGSITEWQICYNSIHDRREQAHQRTCLWVYDPDKPNFAKWPRSDSSVYWINGPAGSGKSTKHFFIDGLGGYHGPEETILKVVKSLTAARNIKICASSRPWPAFCAEWNSSVFTFKMQDLSRDDITRYVKEYLESSENFRSAAARDSRYFGLIPDISNKASGVWLCIYLVVRNVLRDVRDMEPYQQWRNRLESPTSEK